MQVFQEGLQKKFQNWKNQITGYTPPSTFRHSRAQFGVGVLALGAIYHLYREVKQRQLSGINLQRQGHSFANSTLRADFWHKIRNIGSLTQFEHAHFANQHYVNQIKQYIEQEKEEFADNQIIFKESCTHKLNFYFFKLHNVYRTSILRADGNVVNTKRNCWIQIGGVPYFGKVFQTGAKQENSKNNQKRRDNHFYKGINQMSHKLKLKLEDECQRINKFNTYFLSERNKEDINTNIEEDLSSEGMIMKCRCEVKKLQQKFKEQVRAAHKRKHDIQKQRR